MANQVLWVSACKRSLKKLVRCLRQLVRSLKKLRNADWHLHAIGVVERCQSAFHVLFEQHLHFFPDISGHLLLVEGRVHGCAVASGSKLDGWPLVIRAQLRFLITQQLEWVFQRLDSSTKFRPTTSAHKNVLKIGRHLKPQWVAKQYRSGALLMGAMQLLLRAVQNFSQLFHFPVSQMY